jgi:transposase
MIPRGGRVLLAVEPCDMRRSIEGLRRAVAERFGEDASSALYIFANARRDRLKVLWCTATGWCVLYKRLDKRRVQLPAVAEGTRGVVVDGRTLALLLDGVPAQGAGLTAREIAHEARRKVRVATTNQAARG